MSDAEPCPKCGRNRWKTLAKGAEWMCRRCGYVRLAGETA
jgi:ribosomal protein L37AE/L43A